jgi:DNA repair protein RadC
MKHNIESFNEKNIKKDHHYIGHRKRVKDKFLNHSNSLLNYELIELLLFFSIPRKDTKILAKEILKLYNGNMQKIFYSESIDMKKINNMNDSTILLFNLIKIIYKKIHSENFIEEKFCIDDSNKLINFLKTHIGFAKKENLCEIFLDAQLNIIKYHIYDYGTIDAISIYSKDIVSRALEYNAKNIIISHNHPSSNVNPSEEDKKETKKLNELAFSFGIELIDHIIIHQDNYFSFYANGLL